MITSHGHQSHMPAAAAVEEAAAVAGQRTVVHILAVVAAGRKVAGSPAGAAGCNNHWHPPTGCTTC